MPTATATWTKLLDGAWGIWSAAPLATGQPVTVHKKDGTTSVVSVASRIAPEATATYIRSGPGADGLSCAGTGGRCRSRGCHALAVRDGYCRQCHHDEFDI